MICDDCTSWYAKMELRPWYFRPSSILVDTTYGINSRELAVLHWSRAHRIAGRWTGSRILFYFRMVDDTHLDIVVVGLVQLIVDVHVGVHGVCCFGIEEL